MRLKIDSGIGFKKNLVVKFGGYFD